MKERTDVLFLSKEEIESHFLYMHETYVKDDTLRLSLLKAYEKSVSFSSLSSVVAFETNSVDVVNFANVFMCFPSATLKRMLVDQKLLYFHGVISVALKIKKRE